MDLGSLLNQGSPSLSLQDIYSLLKADGSTKLDKINNATFDYPATLEESYEYFGAFIQLLVSVHYVDSNFGEQYAKTIVIDSLRSCIKGLLDKYNLPWLLHFPRHFSTETWQRLKTSTDATVLIYLYGLVLALAKMKDVPIKDWALGMAHFANAHLPAILLHTWMNLWAMDTREPQINAKVALLNTLESLSASSTSGELKAPLLEMIRTLYKVDISYLASNIDQQLGNDLLRPPFSKDELVLAFVSLQDMLERNSTIYPHLSKTLAMFKRSQRSQNKKTLMLNPLLENLHIDPPSDYFERMSMLHKGTQLWIQKMGTFLPYEFEMYIEELIQQQYPAERKAVLDLVLADWTARDPFGCHINTVMDALISQFSAKGRSKSKPYNKRSAPFYAFIQMFSIPDENHKESSTTLAYNIKTGAEIDLSRFHRGTDIPLARGCGLILKKLTLASGVEAKEWLSDCLRAATPDILQAHVEWVSLQLNTEFETKSSSTRFRNHMQATLCNSNTRTLSSDMVPTLLRTLSEASLAWMLRKLEASNVIIDYFSEGPQLATKSLVNDLLLMKSKAYMDLLLMYLCGTMSSTVMDDKHSRAWFKHHFLGTILAVAGDVKNTSGVASQLFQQILKTPTDYEWYLATPIHGVSSETFYFQHLNLAKTHSILPVRNIGLASLLQEMVRLDDHATCERLVKMWYELWTTPANEPGEHDGFTVPVDWILQCIGLYDQAPPLVKQMIERFMTIGTLSRLSTPNDITTRSELTFTQRLVELVMLSDTPEADGVFDLFVRTNMDIEIPANKTALPSKVDEDEIVCFVVFTLVELAEELKLELQHPLALVPWQQTLAETQLASATKSRQLQQFFKKTRNGKKRLRAQKAAETAVVEATTKDDTEMREKDSSASSNKALTIYIQRALNFVFAILTMSDEHSLCVPAKQRLRVKLTGQLLLYEPLGTLSRLVQHEEVQEDIQAIIDTCLIYLREQDEHTMEKAKKVLKLNQ